VNYPILIEHYTGKQSMTIVCKDCHTERVLSPDDLSNEGIYHCAACDAWNATYKYEEADKCPNCGTLGFYEAVLDYCCSRVCQLQTEYARDLKART
jgi:hypothetical protein